MDENMNLTEMVDTQVAEAATAETTKGDSGAALLTVAGIAAAGYGIGKLIEFGVKKAKSWWHNRKKAAVAEEQPAEETTEVEVTE